VEPLLKPTRTGEYRVPKSLCGIADCTWQRTPDCRILFLTHVVELIQVKVASTKADKATIALFKHDCITWLHKVYGTRRSRLGVGERETYDTALPLRAVKYSIVQNHDGILFVFRASRVPE
jgi:hypothetical protein